MTGSALRWFVLLGCAVVAAACEGLVSPLSGPSAFRPPAAVAPPSPTAPSPGSDGVNLLGSWAGTTTISAGLAGLQATNVCVETWLITSQTDGNFSGMFQASGGITVDCAQTGAISGTYTANGSIAGVIHEVGANSGCAKVSSTPYSGTVNATTLTATATERLTCGSGATTAVVNRTLVVSMNRR
jgi:hypothetical protein